MRPPTDIEINVMEAILDNGPNPIAQARAAIRAMREPTVKMECAPRELNIMAGDYIMASHEAAQAWRAMIDAASPPE